MLKTTTAPPRVIAYHISGLVSFILDGHHKACAAALLGKPVNCLVIIGSVLNRLISPRNSVEKPKIYYQADDNTMH